MEKNYTLIEKYLLGNMSEEEIVAFKNRLQTDDAFAKEYELRKSMNIFLEKDKNQSQLVEKLDNLGNEFFSEKKEEKVEKEESKVVPMFSRRMIITMISAAAIALILLIWNPLKKQSIYDQYAMHDAISLTQKSAGSSISAKAEKNFNAKNYENSYQNLTTYLQEFPEDQKAKLALGISALEIGKTDEAINIFSTIQNGSSTLKHYGTWYLALANIKNNDFEKAKIALNQIPESEKRLFDKAQQILKAIN